MKIRRLTLILSIMMYYLPSNSAEGMEAIYWMVEPFIFQRNTREIAGIIPEFYQLMSGRCYGNRQLIHYKKRISTQKEFTDLIYNTIRLKVSSNHTWFPLMQLRNETFIEENYIYQTFIYSTGIVVITKRDRTLLFHRLWLGFVNSCNIVILAIAPTILFAILIWISETFWNPETFDRSFIKGVASGLWWGVVTVTRVGYGDTEIRSLLGKSVATLWMIVAVITSALVTATIINAVNGKDHLDITKKTVAALRYSTAGKSVAGSFQSNIKEYDSYKDIVSAVRNDDVFAGVINSDVAAYMQKTILDENNDVRLSIVSLLPLEQPIFVLVPASKKKSATDRQCENDNIKDIVEYLRRKYSRLLKIEPSSGMTLADLFRSDGVKYFFIAVAILTLCGLVYDLVMFLKGKYFGGKPTETIPPPIELNQNGKPASTATSSGKIDRDIARLKDDVLTIKEAVDRLTQLMSYKKTCTVCSWNR